MHGDESELSKDPAAISYWTYCGPALRIDRLIRSQQAYAYLTHTNAYYRPYLLSKSSKMCY